MAPSRRKGANKAAAAAAALQRWKVGDLVLAKVKGFPAWPATVSEPQKWGYSADLKKVLVYFFGTQQIALCNPGDVEEFTEEKKVSLLGKCRGKGSDFVRALNEIVDCFEKLKKQDQVTSDDITEETVTNGSNSDESLTKSVNAEAPVITVKALSSGNTNDLNSLTEAAAAKDALHDDEEMQLEEAHSNSVFTEAHVYSTRSKTDAAQSQNIGVQGRIAARNLRSSSRKDSSRLQNLMLPCTNSTWSSRRLGTNALQDRSLRRSKRIMKSSDDSEGHDVSSPAVVSNNNIEENDSEVMTVDSDTLSFSDGSCVDSDCKPVGEELFNENNEMARELNDRLDFRTNAAITKRKRKPSRKRDRNDIVQVAKPDEVVSEANVIRTECNSPFNNEKVVDRCAKEDGDEHLPLVKRARVRMGRPSPAGDEEGTLVHEEEKGLEAPDGPLNCIVDASADGDPVPIKGDPGNLSLLHANPARKPQYLEARKNLVDGEAALPPSKRLHRALEAMSANAAEDSQRPSSCSPTVNTHNNGHCSSSSAEQSMGEKAAVYLGPAQVEDHSKGDSQSSASEFGMGLNMEVPVNDGKSFEVGSDCGKSCGIDSSSSESCKDSSEHVEGADSELQKLSPSNEWPTETDAEHQHVKLESSNTAEELSHLDCDAPCSIISPNGCRVEPSVMKEVPRRSDPDVLKSDSMLVEGITGWSLNKGISTDSAEGEGDERHKTEHLFLSRNQDCERSELMEEVRSATMDSNVVPSSTHMNDLTSCRRGYLFHSNSSSDNNHLEDRVVSVTQSSSHVIDGPDPIAKASPSTSSPCKFSGSDNNCYVEKKSSSPDVHVHHEKAKVESSKRESVSSFETIVRSLTRAKESIGRATRIAMDCAKFGFATKVVEILTRNLESESSPHKKVDLLFLVDSIAQCSGGMKGDAGIYPSAIQAVLPRLLLAAAPPGTSFYENHRQCLKVLRVWLERKILPDSMIRHQIRDLDALYGLHLSGGSRRSCRFERPFDDPIRDMDGMLVDEYGSNSSIQLPGFCMPPMLRDDDTGSDSDGDGFEAVTPEHDVENFDGETTLTSAVEKRSHILEEVDGELEMEDVAPCCEIEKNCTNNSVGTDCRQMSHHRSDNNYGESFGPQQPEDTQLVSAPLPRSPPPPPPPPPSPPPHTLPPSVYPPTMLAFGSNGPDLKLCPSQEPRAKQSLSPRVKPRTFDPVHHRVHDNEDPEAQLPRQMPDCSNDHPFSDQPTSHLSGRASDGFQSVDGPFSKGFHLRPPYPAPSNQFSYVQEQRIQSRREFPPPSHPNRFHSRNAENGNFYRDRDRNKYAPRDNIGEYWRPPLPSISGQSYHDGSRMAHAPMYGGPLREPALPNNRWNFTPRSMNQRQFHPYRPHLEGPIPVSNRGSNFWTPR